MRHLWETPGGVHLSDNKAQSQTMSIGQVPLPKMLVLPLNSAFGETAKASVRVGDRVLKGQKIADIQGKLSVAVHASSSGIVSSIEPRTIAHPSGLPTPCIEITTDGEDRWIESTTYPHYQHIDPSKLCDIISQAGIVGMGGAGFPSAVKLAIDGEKSVDTLIINATECEPFITADDMLIRERAAEIVRGIDVINCALGKPKTILIGIENNKPEAIKALQEHCNGTHIEVVSIPTKYPSGGEKQLIYILTGKEIPSGALPMNIGMVCLNIATVFAIKRAVIDGQPLISRVTTITGQACDINRNYEVLIGTSVEHLLELNEFNRERCSRLIVGGPMMGFTLSTTNVSVTKTSACILAVSHQEMPDSSPPQPCIRCGLCAEACPASLLPQQLYWYAKAENHERLQAHHLFDCIECGACSYVCPSKIPLVQHYRTSKGDILTARAEKAMAFKARERFEFRAIRLDKIDHQRESKRESRKLFSNNAAQQRVSGKPPLTASAEDIIKAAQLRIQTKQISPEKQKAKLERTLIAAQMRLEEAEQRLADVLDSGTLDQQTQHKATLEGAKQKVDKTQQRLAKINLQ
ncbi:MAG: electron transport complex subunit RsxC [Porticoccaceae bacterium]|nr:electron transport complex subunit RsxC [Porticoccaceae bacterium]